MCVCVFFSFCVYLFEGVGGSNHLGGSDARDSALNFFFFFFFFFVLGESFFLLENRWRGMLLLWFRRGFRRAVVLVWCEKNNENAF